jgi:hypothetical protein
VTFLQQLADSFISFCDHFKIGLLDWQREDFGEACRREGGRFVNRLAAISVPRGDGKSYGGAARGVWQLVTGRPGTDGVSVALDRDGAHVVLDHAKTIIRNRDDLAKAIEIRANALLVPATGSRWTVNAADHEDTRGRHPDFVVYDEPGYASDDELFASLLAGQASVPDPQMLVISTVGRRKSGPLWRVKTLAEGGDPDVLWRWCGHNRSPLVTQDFLDRQRRLLMPAQFAREHQNLWVDAADSFTSATEVDSAMGRGWAMQHEGEKGRRYRGFVDLGIVSDPTVIALGHEDAGVIFIDLLQTFQGSREQPVQLDAVESALQDLSERFTVDQWRIESWQGVAAVQSLQRAGLPVELFAPTAAAHASEWPILAQRLSSRTIALPRHERLRDELLGLVYEVGPRGVRVVDKGRVHQDHAVAVRGVVASLHGSNGDTVSIARTIGFNPEPTSLFPVNYGDPVIAAERALKAQRGWCRTTF